MVALTASRIFIHNGVSGRRSQTIRGTLAMLPVLFGIDGASFSNLPGGCATKEVKID
jgi:hypothetical protein